MKRVAFYTLGCRLNQSETAVIARTFEEALYQIVDFKQPADIAVINTCTVTENGDADTRHLVNRACRLNPDVQIALIGCQAQIQKEQLLRWPNVRWVIGTARKTDLARIIQESEHHPSDTPEVVTPAISRDSFTMPAAGIDRRHTRANLKIQDGCDFFCSFCEIPYARGRARSREFDDILKEARILAEAGHQEIVLTGINMGTYRYNNYTLIDLITALEQISRLRRIRISSVEPTTIPFALVQKMAQQTKLCRYLHIPLQSASDRILKLMKRKYTAQEFARFIQRASATVAQICIGTDVIVGFPSETEGDFEATYDFLRRMPFHYFHVFSYSRRHMAKSQGFSAVVPSQEIQRRSRILRELGRRKKKQFYQSLVGTESNVLFEQKKNGYWTGLTDNYVRVNVTSSEDLTNRFLKVRLLDSRQARDVDYVSGVIV